MKLELGSGHRPTRGYEHNDLHPFPHIEYVGEAWMLDLPDNSLDEVLALAFIEHLTYDHALDTFRNVHRMLKPGGVFLFDVPDYPVWVGYYLTHLRGECTAPMSMEATKRTLFGWQRWPGDEHLYGWDLGSLRKAIEDVGFSADTIGSNPWVLPNVYRQRFHNPADAHIYVTAIK